MPLPLLSLLFLPFPLRLCGIFLCCLESHFCFPSGSLPISPPVACGPPGSAVHGILQARILEWEPFCSPGDLPNSGIIAGSLALQADSLLSEPRRKPRVRLLFPISMVFSYVIAMLYTHLCACIFSLRFKVINYKSFTLCLPFLHRRCS